MLISDCVTVQSVSHSHHSVVSQWHYCLQPRYITSTTLQARGISPHWDAPVTYLPGTSADSVDTNAPYCTLNVQQPTHNNTLSFNHNILHHNNYTAHLHSTHVRQPTYDNTSCFNHTYILCTYGNPAKTGSFTIIIIMHMVNYSCCIQCLLYVM